MMNDVMSDSWNPQDLSSLSETEQFNQICVLLEKDIVEGLKIATSKIRNKKIFQDLLEKGLQSANASDIEIWLKYLIPRLGLRYVIDVLEQKIPEQPIQVRKATYWLQKYVNHSSEKELSLLKDLERKMIGEEYKAISTSGRSYKLILRLKSTNEYVIFGGYQIGSNGSGVIAEILDPQTFYPTGGVKLVSPGDLEVLNPQPYND